jgi:hypothetical protein
MTIQILTKPPANGLLTKKEIDAETTEQAIIT